MKNVTSSKKVRDIAIGVIRKELEQVQKLASHINDDFAQACKDIVQCEGKVIVSGIGKSGHIGKKIASTLASTGTPSFFIHLAEALHGDLGMIGKHDIVLIISNSGEAIELKSILPILKRKSVKIIAITGNTKSYLALQSSHTLCIAAEEEACPLGLAPSSSAVNTLVLGDALALTTMEMRGFNKHDFALSHPAGSLGNRLLCNVGKLINKINQQACCTTDTALVDAISIMCHSGLGLIAIVEDANVKGVFTDGDLRRALHTSQDFNISIGKLMNQRFTSIQEHELSSFALDVMHRASITALPVLNKNNEFCGVINLNAIHAAGIY